MKRLFGPRRTATLSQSVHKYLHMYAVAASAAGALALASSAEAEIVYTPAHQNLPLNKDFFLDLNNDGKNDFKFNLHSLVSNSEPVWSNNLKVDGLRPKNGVWSFVSTSFRYSPCAAALPKGTKVGPKSPIAHGSRFMFFQGSSFTGYGAFCPWLSRNVKTQAYLGLKFSIKGQLHYGWARLGNIHSDAGTPTARLTGYAYETIPNKPIITGKTKGSDLPDQKSASTGASVMRPPDTPQLGTLGALAMGSPGLSIWRRERLAEVMQ